MRTFFSSSFFIYLALRFLSIHYCFLFLLTFHFCFSLSLLYPVTVTYICNSHSPQALSSLRVCVCCISPFGDFFFQSFGFQYLGRRAPIDERYRPPYLPLFFPLFHTSHARRASRLPDAQRRESCRHSLAVPCKKSVFVMLQGTCLLLLSCYSFACISTARPCIRSFHLLSSLLFFNSSKRQRGRKKNKKKCRVC